MASKTKKAIPVSADDAPLYSRVREILESARSNVARTVNTTQVMANWLVGQEIVEEEQAGKKRAVYGEALLADIATRLLLDFGKGWSVRQLEYCRNFYLFYPRLLEAQKTNAVRSNSETPQYKKTNAVRADSPATQLTDWMPGRLHSNLSWTHYRTLLRVGRTEARNFYEIEAAKNAWSAREMERQISSLLFDRLAKSKDKKGLMRMATHGHEVVQPIDALKDPVVLEFLDLPVSPRLQESKLEQALIGNLETFLMELGKGFAFVSRQERITLDGDHFYIDLVFYHTLLKCFVLIDLKVGKLTHADLGQIQFYVNYYDRERRTEGDNPTLGLILCPDKNDAVVKYTLGEQEERNIFTSRYQLHLPTVEELENELRRELRYLASPESDVAETAPKIRKPRKGKSA
jgi:predicted nuclease of restriction endonuclease-like (RecB) superfamily